MPRCMGNSQGPTTGCLPLTLLFPRGISNKSNEDCGWFGTGMAATTHKTATKAKKLFIVIEIDWLSVFSLIKLI